MPITPTDDAVQTLLERELRERFARYVAVHTTSDEQRPERPSTACQLDLLRMLRAECGELGLVEIHLEAGFLYARLPAREGYQQAEPIGLYAHVDTSPEQPGDGVEAVFHEAWDGEPIRFRDDPELRLGLEDDPDLAVHRGHTIVTAAGRTLLGADDKAGIAEILAAVAALRAFEELPHGELRLCFTCDEEIGRGVVGIDSERIATCGYTIDGGNLGGVQSECFDAWGVTLTFEGHGVHPGRAKDRLVNALTAAARLVAELPPEETPERTEGRDGFIYVYAIDGGCEQATVRLIVRDFEREANRARLERIEALADDHQRRTPGLTIRREVRHQYPNMAEAIRERPEVLERARAAIADCGLTPHEEPIRGGTDGSLLADLGHPTPNLFTGGHLGHSRREWVAVEGMVKASETILHLCRRWATA